MALFKSRKKNDIVVKALQESKKTKSEKYETGLKTSRDSFTKKILKLATKHRNINEEYFKDLEEVLIMADVGVSFTMDLIEKLKTETKIKNITDSKKMNKLIFDFLFKTYSNGKEGISKINIIDGELNVILVMGVNGVGKTTTIGKLAKIFVDQGKEVSLAAADTFRAGAVAQLEVWAERTNCSITIPEKEGQDPSSVVFKAIHEAINDKTDILIVDTAGRLQNKEYLMKELEKMNKIIERESGKKAIETLLILDATTGQNGILQASAFNEVTKLTGIVLTKMDSSSKGGIILSIKDSFDIPVKFIGLGEDINDLEVFDPSEYLKSLTKGVENE